MGYDKFMIRKFSAGGVVYKKSADQILFLIRQSTFSPSFSPFSAWSLPKGWLDDAAPGQPGPLTLGLKRASPAEIEQTALREVREETGVEAKIIGRLGTDQFFFTDEKKQKVFKTVIFFLMEYIRDLPEGFGPETSQVNWVDVDTACNLLAKRKGECKLIRQAILKINETQIS
jgi:ADP-ribose pyrophosphatase YjhB (NUDIX family)